MTIINLDDELHKRVGEYVKKHKVDYPSTKNFVDKTIKKELNKLEKKK